MIFANLVPGFWVDFSRKMWNKEGSILGDMIGLSSSYALTAILMSVASFLKAQQLEWAAYAAVIIHNIGRCFGVLWNPVYFFLFPVQQYGFVFGSISLLSQPFSLLNIVMLNYNTENDDYALTNYILGGVILLVSAVSLACFRKYKSAPTIKTDKNEAQEMTDL